MSALSLFLLTLTIKALISLFDRCRASEVVILDAIYFFLHMFLLQLAMGKMMDQGPVLIITFQAQLVMVIRNANGDVVEGDPVSKPHTNEFDLVILVCLKNMQYNFCHIRFIHFACILGCNQIMWIKQLGHFDSYVF